jgi:predicted secreted Zn-dependent protease
MKDLTLFQKKYVPLLLVVALVAAGGIYLTLRSHAATPYASVNAASGSIASSAFIQSDASSTGGSYVQFSTPNPQSCTKVTDWINNGQAKELPISTSSPGLDEVTDPTQYYELYGYTAQQIDNEMLACSPVVNEGQTLFAQTDYDTNYVFNTSSNSNGTCSVTDVAVGLHFAQIFPSWSASRYDTPGLSTQWANFMSSLQPFEEGHINIISQYANTLLSGLQTFPAGSNCTSEIAAAENYGNAELNAGIQADTNYDVGSNHGPSFP